MKTSLLIAFALALPAVAQDAAPTPPPAALPTFVATFDADKDGKIDDNEKKAMEDYFKADFMNKYDVDKDGKIDDNEKKALPSCKPGAKKPAPKCCGPACAPKCAPGTLPPFIATFDADKDGKIDDNEKKAIEDHFKAEYMNKYDVDKDGKIDDNEKKAINPPACKKPTAPQCAPCVKEGYRRIDPKLIISFDADKDGKIDDNEKKAMREHFHAEFMNKYDVDKDGKIDDNEKKAIPNFPNRPGRFK